MWIGYAVGVLLIIILALSLLVVSILFYQGKRPVVANGEYVALGSSFAAGIGLGPRAPGSPLVCQRTLNGYPQKLAALTGLALVDMSCSGTSSRHVLRGGQVFLGPQIDALGPDTKLVTLTVGGNDVSYVGDLTFMALRQRASLSGRLIRRLWKGPKQDAARDFAKLQTDLVEIIAAITKRAPRARIVVVTYPLILPPDRTCPALGIDDKEAALVRSVGERLRLVTIQAAHQAGAIIVDMTLPSADHHACSAEPWTYGAAPAGGGMAFHPTLAGSEATAREIWRALGEAL